MPSTATVRLEDHLNRELLLEVVQIMGGLPARLGPGYVDDLDADFEDDELELFYDWDNAAGRGRGFFATDEAECRSRRVDLRGPTDADPGPLEMEEFDPEVSGDLFVLTLPGAC